MVVLVAFPLVVKVVGTPLLRLLRRKPLKPPTGPPKTNQTTQNNKQNMIKNKSKSLPTETLTPYSMNSLFSEFFRKFGGVFLEVRETISGVFGSCWEEIRRSTLMLYVFVTCCCTPYSMNSLFSQFCRKFAGVFHGMFETI